VPKVEQIVDEEVATFGRRYRELEVEPLLAALRLQADTIREQEVERALRRLGHADPETAEQLDRLSRALVKKLLHEPTVRLRDRAGDGGAEDAAAALRDLFGLGAPREP
jgi:glutamyl-tRNA reductase